MSASRPGIGPRRTARLLLRAGAVLALVGSAAALVVALNLRGEDAVDPGPPLPLDRQAQAAQIARGAYLARAGNCSACHTARGGAEWAGGRGIETPFGTVHAGNLTPDPATGIGDWNASHFWRAMHNGRSKDGRLLYPAFPYTHYTRVTREDSDALFAFLRTVPPVVQQNRPHALRFPYDSQVALAVWRALYFQPEPWRDDPAQDATWNRGAYLVRGLAHCSACHAPRNAWGAIDATQEWSGGLLPLQRWYAPSLRSASEGGVGHWSVQDVVRLLRDGVNDQASVLGPMAEVVHRSTAHLSAEDLSAMAVFLRTLAAAAPPTPPTPAPPDVEPRVARLGAGLYAEHCAGCHGDDGRGTADAFPPLAGNRAVLMANPANVVRVVLHGGFLPSTPGNPRPHGMPPFSHQLTDEQVAAVVTYLRTSWGNAAAPVGLTEVLRYR
jgi:mono/diheme cytochrome c family protein